jgi:hypothetical protein
MGGRRRRRSEALTSSKRAKRTSIGWAMHSARSPMTTSAHPAHCRGGFPCCAAALKLFAAPVSTAGAIRASGTEVTPLSEAESPPDPASWRAFLYRYLRYGPCDFRLPLEFEIITFARPVRRRGLFVWVPQAELRPLPLRGWIGRRARIRPNGRADARHV